MYKMLMIFVPVVSVQNCLNRDKEFEAHRQPYEEKTKINVEEQIVCNTGRFDKAVRKSGEVL